MANSANLPSPFGGINQKIPIAVLKHPYCQELVNFNTTEAGIELRKGDSLWTSQLVTAANTEETFLAFLKYGDISLFYTTQGDVTQNKYYDITAAGTPTVAHTSTSNINGEIFSVYFNKYLYVFGTLGAGTTGDQYNGSAWSSWTWTLPANFKPISGCAYQNRVYFINRISATYGYGPVSGITGTITEIDLSGIILEQSYLSTIAPLTIANAGQTLQVLAFVFFSGEVLFYTGTYPDSPTWQLVGRGKIGKPLNYGSSIDYQGDALIKTRIGLVSLRDVYLSGSQQAASKTVSEAIDPFWTDFVNFAVSGGSGYYDSTTGRVLLVSGDWWAAKNKIVIGFPYKVVNGVISLGKTYFIFDTLRQSWSIHISGASEAVGLSDLIEFNDSLYISGGLVSTATDYITTMKKEGATDFQDVSINPAVKLTYNYNFLSAPIPFPKTAVYEATAIEPIIESDLYAETNWNFVADFGRQTSGDQTTNAITTSVAKPLANVGIQNITYVQVKMSGTTAADKTVGLDLYSYNVWYDAGQTGSR